MKLDTESRNARFMNRYEVARRQRELTDGGVLQIVGHNDLFVRVVNVTNTRIPGWSSDPDRINDDIEIKIETEGHEWYLLPRWVDTLVEFLQKVQKGRKE